MRLAMILLLIGFSLGAVAEGVDVNVSIDPVTVRQGDDFDLTLSLGAENESENGFGIAIAFDSQKVSFDGVSDVFGPGFFAMSSEAEPDLDDIDHDSATDRLVRITWVSLNGRWKGMSGDAVLAKVLLHAIESKSGHAYSTTVTISSLSEDRRHSFKIIRHLVQSASYAKSAKRGGYIRPVSPAAAPVVEISHHSVYRPLPRRSIFLAETSPLAECSLDADGNGQLDALADGLLIIRHLFGFSGATLIAGAVGDGATRTSAAQIVEYLTAFACADLLDTDGNGGSDALADGLLIIRYLFGFTGDTLVNGAVGGGATRITAADIVAWLDFYRNLSRAIELRSPQLGAPLLSDVPATLKPQVRYSGSRAIRYHLQGGPDGMTIDTTSGELSWTPPRQLEGTSVLVTINATDGEVFAELEFDLAIAAPVPVQTNVNGSTVVVTEAGSLQGVAFTFPASPSQVSRLSDSGEQANAVTPAEFEVAVVPDEQAAVPPADVIKVSDFFRTSPVRGEDDIVVTLPTRRLPDGRSPAELELYIYTDAFTDSEGADWIASQFGLEITSPNEVTIRLRALGEVFFIGLPEQPAPPAAVGASTITMNAALPVNCVAKTYFFQSTEFPYPPHQVCTVAGDSNFEVLIKDFTRNQWTPATTIEELVSWLYEARGGFDRLRLSYDDKFEAKIGISFIDQLRFGVSQGVLGFVSYKEDSRVLHLTKAMNTKDNMQGTAVHEYFHHAQARTTVDGLDSLSAQDHSQWLTEGTARWFEDYLFDDLNTYRTKQANPLPQIMSAGFAAFPHERKSPKNSYARFAMWKLLFECCQGFSLPDILNADLSSDPGGLTNLADKITSQAWDCDFGDGFGIEGADRLDTALLYYQYATIRKNDISLLDRNEDSGLFKFDTVTKEFHKDGSFPEIMNSLATLSTEMAVPPAGARSFLVKSIPGNVPENRELFLDFSVTGGNASVSIASTSEFAVTSGTLGTEHHATLGTEHHATLGTEHHAWFHTGQQTQFVYGHNGSAPELFVTVVNPSTTDNVDVALGLGIREIPGGELVLTSPLVGESYDERVINVSGTIPAALAGMVDRVLITQPNFSGAQNIATVSGDTFSGLAVIRLGGNTITVRGLDAGGQPVTIPTTVSFTGIESATPTARNALIKSNLVFVLNWNTNFSDIDQYVTDPTGGTIWYANPSISGVGRQDVDDVNGFGPEVTTYFTAGAPEGPYEVNINYYGQNGAGDTDISVDVLLNEGSNSSAVGFRYISETPLTDDNRGAGFPPAGDSPSWKADVLKVNCSGSGLNQDCSLI